MVEVSSEKLCLGRGKRWLHADCRIMQRTSHDSAFMFACAGLLGNGRVCMHVFPSPAANLDHCR